MTIPIKARTANRYINLFESGDLNVICVHIDKAYLLDEMLGAIMGAKLQGQESADHITVIQVVVRHLGMQYKGVSWVPSPNFHDKTPGAIYDGLENIASMYPELEEECAAIRTSIKNQFPLSF